MAIDEAVTNGKFNAKRLMFGVAKAADMDDARPFHQLKPVLPYSISSYLQNDPDFVRSELNVIIPLYQSALEFLVPAPPPVSK